MNKQDKRPILPVCFCIHRNGTMGAHIQVDQQVLRILDLVTEGIRRFVDTGMDPNVPYQPDTAILLFSGASVWLREFGTVTRSDQIPDLTFNGIDCCLGNALGMALDAIQLQTERCAQTGLPYMKPILVVVSAGEQDDGPRDTLQKNAARCGSSIRSGDLTAVMYGVTNYANEDLLRFAAPGGIVEHVRMRDLPEKLSGVGIYAQEAKPRSGTVFGDAREYILGIYTDVLRERG